MKKEVLQSIKVTALALILAFSINYVVAWTGPTTNPPPDSGSKNVDGPITVGDNIGGKNQVKLGGVNLGKPTSIGKVTDPLTVTTDLGTITAGLDVDGFTLSKGAFIKGLSIISPASNSYKYDKELFKILDSSWDTTDPVFSVDTRKGADTSIRKLYVRTSSLFEDLATFNKDISVQEDATVYGRASVGTMTGAGSSTTYPGSKDEYDFNLKGTTNIGKIPGFCTLSKSDVETNFRLCPTGTYLAGMNPNAKDSGTDWFSTCRVFDSQHSLTGDNCYDHPLLFLDWLLKDQSGGPYGFHGYEDSDCKKKFYRWIDIKGGYFKDTFTRRGTTFPKQLGTYSSSQSLIVWYFGEGAPNDFQEDTSCRNSTFCVHQASSSVKWKGYMQRVKVVVTDSNSRQAAVETAEWMSRNRDCD